VQVAGLTDGGFETYQKMVGAEWALVQGSSATATHWGRLLQKKRTSVGEWRRGTVAPKGGCPCGLSGLGGPQLRARVRRQAAGNDKISAAEFFGVLVDFGRRAPALGRDQRKPAEPGNSACRPHLPGRKKHGAAQGVQHSPRGGGASGIRRSGRHKMGGHGVLVVGRPRWAATNASQLGRKTATLRRKGELC